MTASAVTQSKIASPLIAPMTCLSIDSSVIAQSPVVRTRHVSPLPDHLARVSSAQSAATTAEAVLLYSDERNCVAPPAVAPVACYGSTAIGTPEAFFVT